MGPRFFHWLATTDAYRAVHTEAVGILPAGTLDERWIDVGTGTGMVARAALDRGYSVVGLDRDPSMTAMARRTSTASPRLSYETSDAASVAPGSATVVSAASLLIAVPNPAEVAAALWGAVAPGGHLLIVETTPLMTLANVSRLPREGWNARDRRAFDLWGMARSGRAIDPSRLAALATSPVERHDLLGGLVAAWLFSAPLAPR